MASDTGTSLQQKIQGREAVIAVMGIGYVGLPLAVAFAEKGFRVVGVDTNVQRVNAIVNHTSYIEDVSDQKLRDLPNLTATGSMLALSMTDVVIICVPTPLTKAKAPDLSYIEATTGTVARFLPKGMGRLVVLESTTYPGTTRDVVLPILQTAGLALGADFLLGYSPEMIDPGNRQFGLANTPKIVSGIDRDSLLATKLLYEQVAGSVVPVSTPETAEVIKVYSNTFRNVNIALANEMARLCKASGISAWEVLNVTALKPFGYMPFYPGLGPGGHCLPKDPQYLAHKAREFDFHVRFIELAADINERMPYYVLGQVQQALNKRERTLNGSRVLVLGVAYKKDISDTRDSPSLKLMSLLKAQGAIIGFHDPFVDNVVVDGIFHLRTNLVALPDYDCTVIAVDHTEYRESAAKIIINSRLVYDAKGVTYGITAPNIERLGE